MAAAQTYTIQEIIDICNYELRNQHKRQYTDPEMLEYARKCLELIYQCLVQEKSELIRTGYTNFNTVVGQEVYDLTAIPPNAGDFWSPYRLWLDGFESSELELVNEENRYSYLTSGTNGQPVQFYLEADNIGLLPFPDDVYTVRLKYYPNFVPPATGAVNMPYKNLFNLEVQEGIMMLAQNRESMNSTVHVAMMEIFENRAHEITRDRKTKQISMSPRFR
jgi:hypothetical protein